MPAGIVTDVLAGIGLIAIGWFLAEAIYARGREAFTRDKRVELATFAVAVAVLALIVSGASLAYSLHHVDTLSDRVTALEKTVESMKSKAAQ